MEGSCQLGSEERIEGFKICAISRSNHQESKVAMIYLLREKASIQQIGEMQAIYTFMIKIAVDVRRNLLAGGGEMHADCE